MPLAVGMTLEFALRADRDTRTPMLIAAVVTTVKIAGNAVLIFGAGPFPRLELVGAGLATFLSQVIGLLLFTTVVVRASGDSPLALRPRDFAAARPLVREVVRLAVPGVGERLANNLAMLAYFRERQVGGSPAGRDRASSRVCSRSEERRVGKECHVVCRSRWSPYH